MNHPTPPLPDAPQNHSADHPVPAHASSPGDAHDKPLLPPMVSWAIMLVVGVLVWVGWTFTPMRGNVSPEGGRLLAVFLPMILGLVLQPLPGGAVVLLGVLASILVGALDIKQALGGYMSDTVWLVLAAFMLSRAFLNTGLARRIALSFVRLLGKNTLGLSYAMVTTDTLFAGMIPSNGARVGGVLLPIARSISELFHSYPGATASKLGLMLMLTLYQADVVACSLFLTGQAGNPLAASQAASLTKDLPGGPINLSYGTWFLYACVPALIGLALVPLIIYKLLPPEIKHTPQARAFADDELKKMGPPDRPQIVLGIIFTIICLLWIILGHFIGPKTTGVVAIMGVGVLLLTKIISWDDFISEKKAWDVFVWYGGLVQLGQMLNDMGVTRRIAEVVVGMFHGWSWILLFLCVLTIYFYAHYAFASITTHLIAMYPPFAELLMKAGAPPALVVVSFALMANLSACLTNYGTTPGPIIFGIGYVRQITWWRMGFLLSLLHLGIWLTIGMAWWKFLGLY